VFQSILLFFEEIVVDVPGISVWDWDWAVWVRFWFLSSTRDRRAVLFLCDTFSKLDDEGGCICDSETQSSVASKRNQVIWFF
jgi:hypothetical protein